MENRILSACLASRSNYDQVVNALGGESFADSFSPVAKACAELLEDFYTIDPAATGCRAEDLLVRAQKKAHNPHLLKAIEDFCRGLDGSVSLPNVVHDLREHRRHRVGDQIAGLLANRTEGRELDELIEKYQSLKAENDEEAGGEDEVFNNLPVADLFNDHFDRKNTIPFSLPSLNRACAGGARAGHHILVYGRPELGKSLFCIDQTAAWIEQGFRVLYVENEEPLADTTMRLVGRICRRTRQEVRDNPAKAQDVLDRKGYSNFTGVSLSPGSFPIIERIVLRTRPHVVLLNQLRNIDVGDDNRVTALEKAAIGARNLGKSQGVVVVSVTQAGDSAEGKSFLELSDIDFSKTGIPGAIDLAIGIGGSAEDKRFGIRTLNLPKNKLGGEHTSITTRFHPQTGIVEEISR